MKDCHLTNRKTGGRPKGQADIYIWYKYFLLFFQIKLWIIFAVSSINSYCLGFANARPYLNYPNCINLVLTYQMTYLRVFGARISHNSWYPSQQSPHSTEPLLLREEHSFTIALSFTSTCCILKRATPYHLRPANERRLYFVTTSLIGWVQA